MRSWRRRHTSGASTGCRRRSSEWSGRCVAWQLERAGQAGLAGLLAGVRVGKGGGGRRQPCSLHPSPSSLLYCDPHLFPLGAWRRRRWGRRSGSCGERSTQVRSGARRGAGPAGWGHGGPKCSGGWRPRVRPRTAPLLAQPPHTASCSPPWPLTAALRPDPLCCVLIPTTCRHASSTIVHCSLFFVFCSLFFVLFVPAGRRPKNSALEVDLDFDTTVKPAPAPTEEMTASLDDLIKKRIAEGQ